MLNENENYYSTHNKFENFEDEIRECVCLCVDVGWAYNK